jgi:hypothetical protein
MTIKERVKKALDKNKRLIETDPRHLSSFVEELNKSGLVIKKEYDVPPLDTVGRQIYQEKNKLSS